MSKIFVYGTLKKGYHNHKLIEKSKFVSYGIIKGYTLYDTPYGFPAIYKCDDKDKFVVGEIYEVDEDTSRRVDSLEGYISPNNRMNMYNKLYAVDIIKDMPVEVYVMSDRMFNERFVECNPIWV